MASKAEINRLGDALREGNVTTENLIALDEYRRSFQPAMANVISNWQQFLGFPEVLVQRPSKSTPSIIAKLRRQPTLQLTQIQDIAGLRVSLTDRYSQNVLAERVQSIFTNAKVIDRRATPSYNYRALHLVVNVLDRPVEIQLRTQMRTHGRICPSV
jgi:ppGpp synthetase/RelA/SpoT-type nucleotidyltranferase